MDRTSAFTQPISHRVYTQMYVCKPVDKCCVNTDPATLLIKWARINNYGTGNYSQHRINDLRVLYMILCAMQG
jgi:hypothetical protein